MDEGQVKSEPSRLTQIATQILTGLLASGDYTNSPERYSGGVAANTGRASVRPEAVTDAINVAAALITLTTKQGATSSEQPEKVAPAQPVAG